MRILFFFVHPAKFHFFRGVIDRLTQDGHDIDIAIVSKDVLEDLLRGAGWKYYNIFPEGRRSPKPSATLILWYTGLNFLRTLWRLWRFTCGRRYDLFVTDDCLSIIGKVRRTPTLFYTDNELTTVPESAILLWFADLVFKPAATELNAFFAKKARSFRGYKELAYLGEDRFHPRFEEIGPALGVRPGEFYSLIRLVAMSASHDRGLGEMTDDRLDRLIAILEKRGRVFVSSERPLRSRHERYQLKTAPSDILRVMAFASLFVGDSGTMASEAAVLGVPTIFIHNFWKKLGVMREKVEKYGVMRCFDHDEYDQALAAVEAMAADENLQRDWRRRRTEMLAQCEDVNQFVHTLILNTGRWGLKYARDTSLSTGHT